MAADASINCLASRMVCIEEIPSKKSDQSKDAELLGMVRLAKPTFHIGSISELCSKICTTEPVFPSYKNLLVEESASDSVHSHTFPGQRYRKHTNDKRQSKNVETHLREIPNKTQKVMGKPKLIELYQFSKVDGSKRLELPNGVSIMQILSRVTNAQPTLRRESKYKTYFEKVFHSPVSQSILKDFFWWLFLDGWNTDQGLQEKLFERVSYNYVQIIILANHPYYAEPFLKSYPRLLSQATYAAFCEAFSDSYSNFNHDFKEKLVNLAHQWVTGLKPAARSWLEWNMDDLEPIEIRNRRDLLKSSSLTPQTKSIDTNDVEMHTTAEKFRAVSFDLSKEHRKSLDLSKDQRKSLDLSKGQRKSLDLSKDQRKSIDLSKDQQKSVDLINDQRSSTILNDTSKRKVHKESHPLGKGPDFVRTAFILNGKSPLVMHHLARMNLQSESGMETAVQRTELENLPPIDASTYSDLILDTFKSICTSQRSYREFYDQCVKENQEFALTKKRELQELRQKEALLLSKPREVKRLSDIITLEYKLDKDSSSKATRQAIDNAVNSVK